LFVRCIWRVNYSRVARRDSSLLSFWCVVPVFFNAPWLMVAFLFLFFLSHVTVNRFVDVVLTIPIIKEEKQGQGNAQTIHTHTKGKWEAPYVSLFLSFFFFFFRFGTVIYITTTTKLCAWFGISIPAIWFVSCLHLPFPHPPTFLPLDTIPAWYLPTVYIYLFILCKPWGDLSFPVIAQKNTHTQKTSYTECRF
jgi:hypothetical protein